MAGVLEQSPVLWSVICKAEACSLENYYIGAGCIPQTVWNAYDGRPPMYGIDDIDLVYFDDNDLSAAGEEAVKQRVQSLCGGVNLDVVNEARVHLWYGEHFGYDIEPYSSVEDAVAHWPTTATAVGVRRFCGELLVYAPYGLSDMLSKTVRANKMQITKEIYLAKTEKWKKRWRDLRVIPW